MKKATKIAFGKFLSRSDSENGIVLINNKDSESAKGFGTFSKCCAEKSDVNNQNEKKNNSMETIIGFSEFGKKKARQFNLMALVETARSRSSELSEESSLGNVLLKNQEDEFIDPLPTSSYHQKFDDSGSENSDELDNIEDYELLSNRIPLSQEVSMNHGTRAVIALDLDSAGGRLVSGSIDYQLNLWDFAGMDKSLQSFRKLQPMENHPIRCLQFSATGEFILVISGSSQAKLLDRDGFEKMECVKGDMYITDMSRTKGHIGGLTAGAWHPVHRQQFATSSLDSTIRIWECFRGRQQKQVIKTRAEGGLKTCPTSITYNRDGSLLAAGCNDGSIQMWDTRKSFAKTVHCVRDAHQKGVEISGLKFSYLGQSFATRSVDDTMKLWDMRNFKKPLTTFSDLPARYDTTNCCFSPNDELLLTGEALNKNRNLTKLYFFSTKTFELVHTYPVSSSHLSRVFWHPKINQIFVGCGDGIIKVLYDEKLSSRGAKQCISKLYSKRKESEVVGNLQIITPHALPLFRQERSRSHRRQLEKDRADPVKSRRPDLPITSGQGGRVLEGGSTLSSYVIRNLGLSKRVEDDQNPRDAILKFAAEAAENPYYITPAYNKTQPKPIFARSVEPEEKKKRTQ